MRITDIINELHWARLTAPGADEVGATITSIGKEEPTKIVPISKLDTFEPRDKTSLGHASAESERKVQQLMKAILRGQTVPPVLVRRHDNKWQIIDGHHRLEAHRRLGRKSIQVRVVPAQRITVDRSS